MRNSAIFCLTLAALASLVLQAQPAGAQAGITLPPSGDNQKASVTQWIGLVEVTIDYSSPDVTSPTGEDRTGKIWGQLVPYGLTDLGFGHRKPAPWRAGANENTVFTVSHDVKIEGQPLPAGRYGLHMIAGEEDWTIIFSKNSTSWGSFFYDPAEDALRVTVKPAKNEYRHWLTYGFIDRQPDRATASLQWEHLKVPFTIAVDNMVDLYVENMREELRSVGGFTWLGWSAAAQYCLQNDTNLEEALEWAENAISLPFVGEENFTTLQTKSLLLAKLGREKEAEATITKAISHPAATAFQIHAYGRQLIAQDRDEDALEVFKMNAERFSGAWPVNVGLARGYSAVGQYDEALKYARTALEQAPDPLNRQSLESAIKTLQEGKDFN